MKERRVVIMPEIKTGNKKFKFPYTKAGIRKAKKVIDEEFREFESKKKQGIMISKRKKKIRSRKMVPKRHYKRK